MAEIIEKENMAPKSEEESLAEFREIIKSLKSAELEKKEKGENYNPHFDLIDPESLQGFEQKLFEEYNSGNLGEERYMELKKAAFSHYIPLYSEGAEELEKKKHFWAYIKNEVIKQEIVRKLALKKQKAENN